MRRKAISNNYVSGILDDSSSINSNKEKQFTVSLTEKQWVLSELLVENKILPPLEQYLNEAIQNYIEQMTNCLTGGVQNRYRGNQPNNKVPKTTSFTDDYTDGDLA